MNSMLIPEDVACYQIICWEKLTSQELRLAVKKLMNKDTILKRKYKSVVALIPGLI